MFICAPRRCLKFLRNCSLLPDDQVSVLASIFMPTYKQVFQCSPYSFSLTTFSNPQPSCTFSILIKLQQQRGSEQPDLQKGGGPDLQEIIESSRMLGPRIAQVHLPLSPIGRWLCHSCKLKICPNTNKVNKNKRRNFKATAGIMSMLGHVHRVHCQAGSSPEPKHHSQ